MFPFEGRLMNLSQGTKRLTAFLGVLLILGMCAVTAQSQQLVLFLSMMAALLIMVAIYMVRELTAVAAEEKQRAEEAQKAEEALRYRVALQKLLTTISMNFMNLLGDEIDREINRALRAVAVFTEVDRNYLSLYDATKESWHCSHECSLKGTQVDVKPHHDTNELPWSTERLKQFQSVYIPNLAAMAALPKRERERFEAQGIQSLLFVPMVLGGSLIGLIGFEWRHKATGWADEDIKLFELLAQIFLNALQDAKSKQDLRQGMTEYTAELEAANRELARIARLKDEFLAAMSHELRTPLNAILGISEGLLEEAYGVLNNTQLGALVRIEESARHLLALINDILDLSKIGAGQVELELSPVVVKSVCQASLRFIRESAYRKQLHVLSKFDPKMGTIQADERRLKQILVNLLSNAVKFTPSGGTIGLFVSVNIEQKMIEFCVWDTGIGIGMEKMNDLFKPFVQVDSSLSRHYGGTGLGLSLVQRMVELHHGKITVQSQVDKGSHFIVSLPIEGPETATLR